MQQGTKAGPNPDKLQVNVHLATAELAITAPWQTRLSIQLPVGRLTTSTLSESRTDTGLGDGEFRIRQSLPRIGKIRIDLGAGMVLPTGPYVARSGAANLPPEASFLTLGRGVSWFLGEAQISAPLTDELAVYGEVAGRAPLGMTEDDFDWGSELRGVVGGRYQLPHKLAALAIAEWQWRDKATEPDPFLGGRIDSANAGGHWVTLMPALSYDILPNISVLGGARILSYSKVRGNQLIPSVGAFLSFSGRWAFGKSEKSATQSASSQSDGGDFEAPKPEIGKITIVDYWATWCAPCEEINGLLGEAKPRWNDVSIKKVDASAYPDSSIQLPEGATGLPVIEIYDASGKRVHLLKGQDALKVVDIVDSMRDK